MFFIALATTPNAIDSASLVVAVPHPGSAIPATSQHLDPSKHVSEESEGSCVPMPSLYLTQPMNEHGGETGSFGNSCAYWCMKRKHCTTCHPKHSHVNPPCPTWDRAFPPCMNEMAEEKYEISLRQHDRPMRQGASCAGGGLSAGRGGPRPTSSRLLPRPLPGAVTRDGMRGADLTKAHSDITHAHLRGMLQSFAAGTGLTCMSTCDPQITQMVAR